MKSQTATAELEKETEEPRNGKAREAAPGRREVIEMPETAYSRVRLKIIGTTPLVVNQFKRQIEAIERAQMKKAKGGRPPKDPKAEYEASIYRDDDGHPAIPTCAIKKAIINAADFKSDKLSRGQISGLVRVEGYWTRVYGTHKMRRDWVRNKDEGVDLRYRAEFKEWSAELSIRFETPDLSIAQVLNLVRKAGTRIGLCEGRPERQSALDWGTFRIDKKSVKVEEIAE